MMEIILRPVGILVGFVYPFYASFKALDSKSSDINTQWLTYWIVFSLCNLLEYLLSWALPRLPFFYTAKILFILWLQLPQTKGAMIIYWRVLHPQIKKYEDKIDNAVIASKRRVMRVKDWASFAPPSMHHRATTAAEKVLQELEAGDAGEKGE
eukprot:TRINITY_DN1873_c0_g4_i1.p1 TRINITY_DN1873_c0_g4~~TRINITY_DN1873_c0_g4_i1.p1  ORF type:complete len:153 (+),score=33.86 TRINITY_DN1873_c0_g4_i1:99-557(+)